MFSAAPREGSRVRATTRTLLGVLESVVDRDRCRPQQDDEQCREDTCDQREDDLHWHLLCGFLGPLPALDAHLVRLNVKNFGDRDTEDVRLDHREDEGLE